MNINNIITACTLLAFIILILYIIYWGWPSSPVPFLEGMYQYDLSNINQTYHASFIDSNVKSIGGFALPVFYTPKSYAYSPKAFVPNYVDTIYMSSLTGLSNVAQYYDVSGVDVSGNGNVHHND